MQEDGHSASYDSHQVCVTREIIVGPISRVTSSRVCLLRRLRCRSDAQVAGFRPAAAKNSHISSSARQISQLR